MSGQGGVVDAILMLGFPTRFPLYSKGVDTYRYEYGVFLLNKDIELVGCVARSYSIMC